MAKQIRGQVSKRNGGRLYKAVRDARPRGSSRVRVHVTPTGGEVLKLRGFIWPRLANDEVVFHVGRRMVPVAFVAVEADDNLLFEVGL